jgi:hypothetical protein
MMRRHSRQADGSVKVWKELDTPEYRVYAPVIDLNAERERRRAA